VNNERDLVRDAIAYRDLVATSGELIWSLDLEARWTFLNAAATRFYGRAPEELVGRPLAELVARELQERDEAVFRRVFAGEPLFDHQTRHVRRDGSHVDLSFNAVARRDAAGRIVGATGTARDITEHKRAAAALHETIAKLRLAVEMAGLYHWEWDASSGALQWGRDPEDAGQRATKWRDYLAAVHPEDRERFLAVSREAFARGEPFRMEYRVSGADGRQLWFSARGEPLLDAQGRTYRMVGVSQDITEHKRREEEVRFLAYHDPLTGLPNRRLLDDRLQQALYGAERSGGKLAVLMIDLDHFKAVNDSAGQRGGDVVLREAARRLGGCVRRADTLARHGGDEFVIVLPDQQADADCQVVADRVLRALSRPFDLDGRSWRLGASIGVAVYPSAGADVETLLHNADVAMYLAKELGGNRHVFSSPS